MNARRLCRPVSASSSARMRRRSTWQAETIAIVAWLANSARSSRRALEGSRRSAGSSAQMRPTIAPLWSRSGTKSQWRFQASGPRPLFPARRAAAVHLRAERDDLPRRAGERVGLGEQVAAAELERRVDEGAERLVGQLPVRLAGRRPAGAGARRQQAGGRVAQLDQDLLELQAPLDAGAD